MLRLGHLDLVPSKRKKAAGFAQKMGNRGQGVLLPIIIMGLQLQILRHSRKRAGIGSIGGKLS